MNVPIRLFDTSLNLLAEIDDYETADFERLFYDAGKFQIVINKNKLYATLFDRDKIIMVGDNTDSVGIITEIQKSVDTGGKGNETITVIGRELKFALNNRTVEPHTGKVRYAIPGDVDVITDAGNPIFNYPFYVSRVMVGDVCHIYYTDSGTLYHRTASDALCHTWSVGGACTIGGVTATNCLYPYVFYNSGTFYLILQKTNDASPYSYYMYTSSDGVAWTIANNGSKVFTAGSGIYAYTWSCSIALVSGVMYFFAECGTTPTKATFGIGYSWDTLANLTAGTCNFNTNATATHIIANGGSPRIVYVPGKSSFMLFHAYINYNDITYWQLRVSVAQTTPGSGYLIPGPWTASNNWGLSQSSINLLYPDFLALPATKTYPLLLGYLYGSASNYQAYFNLSLDDFYNIVSANIPAETVIKQLVNDQVGTGAVSTRQFPNFQIATDQKRGISYVLSARYSDLWSEITSFTQSVNMGLSLNIDTTLKKMVFDVIPGVDRRASQSVNGRAIFSPAYETLEKAQIIHSNIKFRNALIVGGKGSGLQQTVLKYYPSTEPTGILRREVFIDARTIDDFALAVKAKNEAEAYNNENTFSGNGLEYGGLKYRIDYNLGDLCTISAMDESSDVRLTGIAESWQNGKYSIVHTFGKPYPTLTSQTANSQGITKTSLSTLASTATTSSSSGGGVTTIQVIDDEFSNINEYPIFGNVLSGNFVPHADSGLTYNPYTGTFSAIKFSSTNLFISGQALLGSQQLQEYTIQGSTNKILQLRNLATGQTSGDVFSILEIRSPDTALVESTLAQHVVVSGIDDWVRDVSFHNYAGIIKAVDVLSHFTGTNAGQWQWVSRYTNGTNYSMLERDLLLLDGLTGNMLLGEDATVSASARGKLDVRTYGNSVLPSLVVSLDSSAGSQPSAALIENGLNFAYGGNLVTLKLLNATDTGTVLKLENAGSGYYILADSAFSVAKNGTLGVTGDVIHSGNKSLYNNFTSGFAGSGWRIEYGVATAGKASMEFDNLTVRGSMRIYELLINQIRASNGSMFVSSACKIKTAVLASGVLGANGSTYTLSTGGTAADSLYHGFLVNDIIRARRFKPDTATIYQVDMIVTAVTDLYTFTAQLVGANSYLTDISVFVGMDFVRLGNTTDVTRQGAVYLTSDDSNAPFIDIVDGIAAHTDWNTVGKVKARLGKLSGITSPVWGTLSGYGLWSTNVYLEGAIKATSGIIGSFTIGTYLYSGTKTAYNDLAAGVHIGSDGIGLGAGFYVSALGALMAKSGTIGTWNIDDNSLYVGVKVNSGSYAAPGAITVGSDGHISANQFRVDIDGSAHFLGAIEGGTIAIGSGNSIFKADSNGIYLGNATFGSAPFSVTPAGALIATNATISGIFQGSNCKIDGSTYSIWTGSSLSSPAYGDSLLRISFDVSGLLMGWWRCISAGSWTLKNLITQNLQDAYLSGYMQISGGDRSFKICDESTLDGGLSCCRYQTSALGTKSTSSELIFIVKKPLACLLRNSADITTTSLYMAYGTAYYSISSCSGLSDFRPVMLNPGYYKLVCTGGGTSYIDFLGVYGMSNNSTNNYLATWD